MTAALLRLATGAAVVLIAANVAAFGAGRWYAAELLSHFRPQYLAGGLVLAATLWLLQRRAVAAACLAVAALNGWLVAPYLSPSSALASEPDLVIAHLNVHGANRQAGRVLDFLAAADADIVVVQEVGEFWAGALAALDSDYPTRRIVARHDNFGIALYSRLPGTRLDTVAPGATGPPALLARFRHRGRPVTLLAMHPTPPVSPAMAATRDRQLAAAAELLRGESSFRLIVGDLNLTPWSPPFRRLLRGAGLADPRAGSGIHATWPALLGPFGIPIDHCLADRRLRGTHIRTGPYVGSDHRGIVCAVTLPAKK